MPARLKPWLRRLRHLAAWLIIILGILSGGAYLLTPLLGDWRDDLARYASEQLGRPVSIGGLKARWRGLGPALRLEQLTLGDPGSDQVIRLERVDLDVGLLDMLLHRNLSPLRVTLHRLQIHLVRETDGRIRLAGLNRQPADAGGSSPLVLPGRLRLRDIELIWEDRQKHLAPLRIPHAQLDLDTRGEALNIAARMQLDGNRGGRMLLLAELDSAPWQADWSGRTYLQLNDISSDLLPADYLPAPYRVHGVARRLALWGDWRQGRMQRLQGQLDLPDLMVAHGERRIRLDDLRGDFRLDRLPRGWKLQVDGFSLSHHGISWPNGRLELTAEQVAADAWQLRGSADYLRLQDLVSLYQVHPSDADMAEALAALDPRGELQQLRFTLRTGADNPWRLAGRLNRLSVDPWENIPGVEGLSAVIRGGQEGLQLDLDSRDLTLTLPKTMRHPIRLERARGTFHWQPLQGQGWQLQTHELVAYNPDIHSRSRLRLETPSGNPADLQIDLQTDFRDGRATAVPDYLPTPIMGDKLVRWLDQAFTGGDIPSGTVLLLGPLSDFPYARTHNGHFEVLFGVEELQVDYRQGWPPLSDVTAELRFHNNDLDIDLDHGRIYDSEILRAHGHISPLNPTGPLQVRGRIRGPLADPLRLLSESPLSKDFGDLAHSLEAAGQSQLQLAFTLPLAHHGKLQLDGRLRFLDATLKLPDWQLTVARLQGELAFDLAGVRGEDIRGLALGDIPVTASVAPGDDGRTWVSILSQLGVDQIRRQLPALPLDPVRGSSEFAVRVGIAGRKARTKSSRLVVESDLSGIAIDLPPPLAKRAAQKISFRLEMPLVEDPVIQLAYGNLLEARFTRDARRSAIRFGGGPAKLPKGPGVFLSGHLQQLDLSPWLDLQGNGRQRAKLPPLRTDLTFGHLAIGDFGIDNIRLAVRETENGWDGTAEGTNFTGRFLVPADPASAPIQIDLDRLGLHFDPAAAPTTTAKNERHPGSPRDWPVLDLVCRNLQVNDQRIGQLDLKLRKTSDGISIAPISLHGDNVSLESQLSWTAAVGGEDGESSLDGRLQSEDFGTLLKTLGFSEQLQKGEATVDFDLSWRGQPTAFSLPGLSGELNLDIEKGVFVEVEPGVSRAIGLLNFAAIQRRLRLDFRDLFGKGFSFDQTSGSFHFDKGNAYTNDLTIKGPSGVIGIAGRTGLVKRDLDQLVTVTPELGAVLPLAVGTSAGPLAGVAVWVAQELASEQIDKINRFQYSVIGPWDNPEVKQLDTGGVLSKLLKPFSGGAASDGNGDDTAENDGTLFGE